MWIAIFVAPTEKSVHLQLRRNSLAVSRKDGGGCLEGALGGGLFWRRCLAGPSASLIADQSLSKSPWYWGRENQTDDEVRGQKSTAKRGRRGNNKYDINDCLWWWLRSGGGHRIAGHSFPQSWESPITHCLGATAVPTPLCSGNDGTVLGPRCRIFCRAEVEKTPAHGIIRRSRSLAGSKLRNTHSLWRCANCHRFLAAPCLAMCGGLRCFS